VVDIKTLVVKTGEKMASAVADRKAGEVSPAAVDVGASL
jgi:hypothetical protein